MPMEDGRWRQVRELFERALPLSAAEREELLMVAAGGDAELGDEVRSLLAAEARAGDFLSRGGALSATDDGPPPPARERIGPWRVVREIGRGGMGVVYLGERAGEGFTQRAAIKVVSGAPESAAILGRFRTERRILAALEHPAIARLLDGGTTDDGLPYLAMEYVEGEGLLKYADARRLDLRRRIELFVEICAAVDHAHRRLVLHRDLKPANVLVGADGRPKLLDFGIGKLLADDEASLAAATSTLERWMTPSYAAPEQILGAPTTTATDVHGLGVVLFELLTGLRPFRRRELTTDGPQSAAAEAPRRASSTADEGRETASARDATAPAPASERAELRGTTPARLRRQLRGDLDTILAKALEPDPSRRYASAAELADDLGRHLRGEPIRARPAGAARRFAKLVLRHRTASALTAAAAITIVTLVAYHTRALERERNVARLEAANASAIASFLTELFQGANPIQTGGATLTARDLLDRGEARLVEEEALEPVVRARLLTTMSLAREALGDRDRSRELARKAAELLEVAAVPTADRVMAELQYAHMLFQDGRAADALPWIERAVAAVDGDSEVPLKLRGSAHNLLATTHAALGDFEGAKRAYDRVVEIERSRGSPARIGRSLNNFGVLYLTHGDRESARALYLQSLAEFERSTESSAYEIYLPLFNLAEIARDDGDLDTAEAHLRRGMAAYEKVFGADSTEVAYGWASIADLERRRGELEDARASIDRAIALYERLVEPDQEDWSWPLQVSGRIHLARGDALRAIADLERALAVEHGLQGDRSFRVGEIETDLAAARRAVAPAGVRP
jgi:serine/threonine-protein kinase